jgi:quercetin dioxygenase-like cupin family protein
MKLRCILIGAVLILFVATRPALSETRIRSVDLGALKTHALHKGEGQVVFLALSPEGLPVIARILFAKGEIQKPYSVEDGRIRFAIVLKGQIFFGEGNKVDPSAEKRYGEGEILIIPPRAPFWVAARDSGAELLIAIVPGDTKIEAPLR